MQSYLTKFANGLEKLDNLMSVKGCFDKDSCFYTTTNKNIQETFEELNGLLDEAEKWIAQHNLHLPPTRIKFKVPCDQGPNKRVWEGCSCYYIDELTQAMLDDNRERYEKAIFGLIDIGRAYDREMDHSYDPEELHDDEMRADKLYGDIYDDGFDRKEKEILEKYENTA